MPHCCVYGCNNKSTNWHSWKKRKQSYVPSGSGNRSERIKNWLVAIGRPKENLPKCPYLCSDHFDPSFFHESVDLRNKFLGKAKRKLKADGAVPSTFLRCFTKLQDISRPCGALYFNNDKAWMRTEVMTNVLTKLNIKIKRESRHIILFLDNASCHPEGYVLKCSNRVLGLWTQE